MSGSPGTQQMFVHSKPFFHDLSSSCQPDFPLICCYWQLTNHPKFWLILALRCSLGKRVSHQQKTGCKKQTRQSHKIDWRVSLMERWKMYTFGTIFCAFLTILSPFQNFFWRCFLNIYESADFWDYDLQSFSNGKLFTLEKKGQFFSKRSNIEIIF